MPNPDYMAEAYEQQKMGGNVDRASVLALLAIAEAIYDLADEIRGLGTQAQPIHVEGTS